MTEKNEDLNQDEDFDFDDDGAIDEAPEEGKEGKIDWEAKAKELEGRNKRLETKIKKQAEKKPNKSNAELDYGQKAFLIANGIKGKDEIKLVTDFMENTGKTLDDVLESKHFMNELKDLRDVKAVNDAVPGSSKRGGGAARNSVEYWLAKGELPPASDVQLRRDVVNAKLKASKEKGMFYNS